MGCTTSCIAPSVAGLNKSVKTGDERALLLQLAACPKLLSTPTSVLSSTAMTPMHQACESKQVKVVQQILTFMACSSLDIVREALLPYCRRMGMPLPNSVCDGIRMAVDMKNGKGQTPLMYACFSDCPELVKLLLAKGADPWVGDRCGRRTALHYAAMGGSPACIQALMKHIPPRLIVRQGARYVDARSLCGLTPLHYCVYYGNLEALRELLTHFDPTITAATTSESYDVGVTCEARSGPLHFAAVTGSEDAAREVLRYFYQRRGSGQAITDPRCRVNAAGQLPWQVAFAHHPTFLTLASLLHPGQPLERVLGAGGAAGGAAAGGLGLGPSPLAAIAGAALRAKLLADLQPGLGGLGGRPEGGANEQQPSGEAGGAEPVVRERLPAATAAAGAAPPVSEAASEALGGGAATTRSNTAGPEAHLGGSTRDGVTASGPRGDGEGPNSSTSSGGSSTSSRCRLVRCVSGRGRRSATVAPLPASRSECAAPSPGGASAPVPAAAPGAPARSDTAAGVSGSETNFRSAGECDSGARSASASDAAGASSSGSCGSSSSSSSTGRCSRAEGRGGAVGGEGGSTSGARAASGREQWGEKGQAGDSGCGHGAGGADVDQQGGGGEGGGGGGWVGWGSARVAVAPVGCRHGLCGGCAEKLCQGVARRPLQCPFCRRVVAGFVKLVPQDA